MNKLILFSCSLIVSASIYAQTKTPAKPAPKTPVKSVSKSPVKSTSTLTTSLKNLTDSASYTIGLSIALSYKQQGVTTLNTGLIAKACSDVLDNKPALINEYTASDVLNKFIVAVKEGKYKPTAAKPAVAKTSLGNFSDSASYSIGIRYASFYKQYGITKLNTALIAKGCSDLMTNKPTLIQENQTNNIMNRFVMKVQEELVKVTVDAGKAFLEENGKRPGVKTTASGLQYEVIQEGSGGNHPTPQDSVTCHYRGTFINGEEFDASYRRGQPITFYLSGVITGWTEGLQYMQEGSKYKFYVPHNLAYGPFDRPGIPGGSMLIFEVELIKVIRN